ncbi:SH3 domain-containing protein [Jiangella endophytica]|uniref:SH3 domain-containing protein n=1 Tax=Jiangella endophytica TaxID=1623398 RepID=UPI000E34854C|nr:SH3 domain-containing protein [Jiangella endophytica]
MIIRQRLRRTAIALATATIVPLGLLATSTAADAATTTYKGRITEGVNVRSAPTSAATKVGSYAKGATITIQCKVFGPSVSGNSLWYKLANGRWVSARYVANIGTAPRFCGDGKEYTGRVSSSTALAVRSGPTTANARVSSIPRGATMSIVCKVDSQSVDGNRRWYQLTGDGGGQWVSARYVANVGAAPPYC